MLERLRQARAALRARLDALLAINDRDLTADELRECDAILSADREAATPGIPVLDARIAELEEMEAREARAAAARAETATAGTAATERVADTGVATITREPETYRRNGPESFFRDLTAVGLNRPNARDAQDRLVRNSREVASAMQERALTTTDTAGGDFVPPLWMVEQYVELARTARPVADRVRNEQLPTGTDQINIPKITSGTAVAEQATQNTAVQNTDAVTSSVAANVATIAGQQVVSVQLLEQSPINMDTILLADLAADYAAKVDLFVLNNNVANKKGLLQEAGTSSVTYVQASPTVQLLWPKLADAVQRVSTLRFQPADTIIMHPRRWAYLLAAVDSTGRPLIVSNAGQGSQNAIGVTTGVASSNGVAGQVMGLDCVLDPQIPTTLGGGTEDAIIVLRAADSILWEGAPNAEAFRETKADQLSVLLRFYRYAAFTCARFPASISKITGTGMIAPTF